MPCLFHGGHDPNLMYKNRFFYCFSQCNRKYTIIDVVQKQLGLGYGDSIKWLMNLLELENSKVVSISEENREQLQVLKEIAKKKERFTFTSMPKTVLDRIKYGVTHEVLTKEGFDKEIFEYYHLGLGLGGYFSDRVFIPIYDPKGQMIYTASGRALTKETEPKYLLWNEADKSKVLYNYHNCASTNSRYVFVVEGFKSIWRLHQWGYDNAVAVLGSSLSEDQKKLLIRLNAKIIVIGDNDKAGQHFNQAVENKLYQFCKVAKINLGDTDCNETDSIAEITKEQFERLIHDSI